MRAFFYAGRALLRVGRICISLIGKSLIFMNGIFRLGILLMAFTVTFSAYAQRKPRIRGNRKVVSVEKPLPSFRHLSLSDGLKLRLQSGNTETVRIEADENLIDILRFEVAGDTLKVGSFYQITGSKQLALTLVFSTLESIRVGQGELAMEETLEADILKIDMGQDARVALNIRAGLLDVQLKGNAAADLRVEADSLHADLGGRTDSRIYTAGASVDLAMTGQASLGLEGSSPSLTLSMTDNARLQAQGMQAEKAMAFMNGSALARLQTETSLSYEGRGNARLFVYGQPEIRILGFYDRAELLKEPE